MGRSLSPSITPSASLASLAHQCPLATPPPPAHSFDTRERDCRARGLPWPKSRPRVGPTRLITVGGPRKSRRQTNQVCATQLLGGVCRVCSAAFGVQRCGSSRAFRKGDGKAARLKGEPCATSLLASDLCCSHSARRAESLVTALRLLTPGSYRGLTNRHRSQRFGLDDCGNGRRSEILNQPDVAFLVGFVKTKVLAIG